MAKILLIDDNPDIGELVIGGLQPNSTDQAFSLAEARAALKNNVYDIILIDVILPDGDGYDFCNSLSADIRYKDSPKIMLTAKDQVEQKVYGFTCGADDYVTKPFNVIELRARVNRRLLRKNSDANKIYAFSCFLFDLEFQRCFVVEGQSKTDLMLTPTEFRLFLALVKNEGQVLTRDKIEQSSWRANGSVVEIRGIDTHVAHLRKKLGPLKACVESVYGQGYTFKRVG